MNTNKKFFRVTSPFTLVLARLLLLAVCVLCATAVLAVNGRDFAGFYRYRLTADFQDTKQVTLTLQLFNYSGSPVSAATVQMEDLVTGATGSIAGVSINPGTSATVSGTFVIPADEFARWQAGGLPHLVIAYMGADGNLVLRQIELGPELPLAGGVQ